MILRILGCLLLAAAGLKMFGMAVDTVGGAGWFSQPWVQTAVVEWEIILGLWLFWGQYRAAVWLATTATFLAFAGVSFSQGWVGQSSCGCLGAIKVNPWVAFGIDGIAMVLLAFTRKDAFANEKAISIGVVIRPIAIGAGGVMLMLGLLTGVAGLTFGSPREALAYLRGERLTIEPSFVDIGEGRLGEQKEVIVHLRNWTDHPIHIIGGTSDCSCVVTRDLPLTVQPGETCQLSLILVRKGPAGQFTRLAWLYTDDPRFHTAVFRLTGRSYASLEERASHKFE